MLVVFGILVILVSLVLGFVVLVQNPKGGGLSGSFGGIGNQLMGVKQTTDVLEKTTWVTAALVAVLCLVSPAFMKGGDNSKNESLYKNMNVPAAKPAAGNATGTLPTPAATPDTNK